MPPLAKRRRLLDNAADVELHEKRLRNNKKLKSRFESIFERYSKDFEGIGDIIDLSQNHIVVDNGHLRDMKGEKDLGSDSPPPIGGTDSLLPESPSTTLPIELIITDSQDDASDVGDESDEDYKNDERDEDDKDDGDNAGDPLSIFEDALATSVQRVRKSVEPSFSRHQNDHINQSIASIPSSPLFRLNNRRVEPAWRVPLLPADMHVGRSLPSPSPSIGDDSSLSASSTEGVSIWALPSRKRRKTTFANSDTHPALAASREVSSEPFILKRPWTQQEQELLRRLKASGTSWKEIGQQLPNRASAAIQMFWSRSKKSFIESSTPTCNTPSNNPLQNLGATSDSQNVATSNPRLLVEVEELDTPALSTATALSPARISKAELKSQLASSLIPEAQSCELATLVVSRDGAFADHSLDHAIPPCRAITQTQTSTVEDDEDDLQILFEPNVTTIFQRKGRHSYSGCKQRLAFRLSLGGDDISDDELSIPAKT
ncbi:MAG: hypothetical protein Q9205_002427 [Flavoplaca limonia]